jgi:hypothetical protein
MLRRKRTKRARNIARMDAVRIEYRVLEGKREGRGPSMDGSIILKCVLKKWGGRCPLG